MAADQIDPDKRIMVAGYCAYCKTAYTMVMGRDWHWESEGYCSKGCTKRAYERRYHTRCPVGCGNNKRSDSLTCARCWFTVTGMCRGKHRLTERKARTVEANRSWRAVWCRCCGWWHNTSHPVENEEELVRSVGSILEAMRRIKGQVWVNELIESWDPEMFDRHAWKKRSA